MNPFEIFDEFDRMAGMDRNMHRDSFSRHSFGGGLFGRSPIDDMFAEMEREMFGMRGH